MQPQQSQLGAANMEIVEPTDDSNLNWHTEPKDLFDSFVYIVFGNMHLGGCGYHFVQETLNYIWKQLSYKKKLLIHGRKGFSHRFESTHH